MSAMNFGMKDLYPLYNGYETSASSTPEADDQKALNQNADDAEKVSETQAGSKSILLTFIVVIALIILLGGWT